MRLNCYTTFRTGILLVAAFLLGQCLSAQPAPFYAETFADSLNFTTKWVYGGTNPGKEKWVWSKITGGLYQGQPAFGSKTAANGFIVFNSDENGEFAHDVTITSPAINCSGQSQVFLRFESQYAYFSPATQSIVEVGVSTDSTTYTYYRVLTNVARNDVTQAVTPWVMELPTAAGKPKVFIRFRWRGFFEYLWRVDDINLYSSNPTAAFDLSLSELLPSTFNDKAEFGPFVAMDYLVPKSQVDTISLVVSAENKGIQDQNSVILKTDATSTNNQTFTQRDTFLQFPKSLKDTILLDDLFVPKDTGLYTLTMNIGSAQTDQNPTDNTLTRRFRVTQFTFAKDDERITSATQPGTVQGDLWEIGNYYLINKDGYEAFEAQFSVASNSNAHRGKSVSILLYKLKNNGDASFNDNDLEIIGYGFYEFPATHNNFEGVTTPLLDIASNNQGVKLDPNGEYILTVQYAPDMFVPFSDIKYPYNFVTTVVKNGGEWFLGGFGDAVTAIVRLRIRERQVTSVKEPQLAESQLTLAPNPASQDIQVKLDLQSVSDQVEIRIVDVAGRTLLVQQYDKLQSGVFNFDVRQFESGTYFLHARTAEGIKTKRFIVQH